MKLKEVRVALVQPVQNKGISQMDKTKYKLITEEEYDMLIHIAADSPEFGAYDIMSVIEYPLSMSIIWGDGTTTSVEYNPWTDKTKYGIALCFMKKLLGNDNTYKKVLAEVTDEH